jgi:DNA-binding NtrC family response regulator
MLLVLDDNVSLCKTMARALRRQGVKGQIFQEWEDAKEALESDPTAFTHALIDFGLGDGQSGLEVIRWIRQTYPHIKCTLMSGARQTPFFVEEPPYAQFLPKPFGLQELAQVMSHSQMQAV